MTGDENAARPQVPSWERQSCILRSHGEQHFKLIKRLKQDWFGGMRKLLLYTLPLAFASCLPAPL